MSQDRKLFYVPYNFKVGRGRNNAGISAITFKNTNGAWLQPSYFQHVTGFPCIDKPREAEVVINRDIANAITLHMNEPTYGFKLENLPSYIDPESSVTISDPRGWKFHIQLQRFLKIIEKKVSLAQDGTIGGSYVYACNPETREIMIINTSWNEFETAIKQENTEEVVKRIKENMTKKNLKVGTVYRIYSDRNLITRNFKRAVYLGEWKYICDQDKFLSMICNAFENGWGIEQAHSKALAIKERIMRDLEKPKMVFMYLEDTITTNIRFNGVNFQRNPEETDKDRVVEGTTFPLNTYIDDILPNHHDYAIQFSYQTMRSCLYVAGSLDPLIIRGEDKNQTIGCIKDWKKTETVYHNACTRSTNRKTCISEYGYNEKKPYTYADDVVYNYETYTIEELNTFLNYIIQKIILPNILHLQFRQKKKNGYY